MIQTGTRFDGRPAHDIAVGGRLSSAISNAILLTNTDLGHQWNLTLKLERPYRDNWFASGSYAYGQTRSSLDATTSQGVSNWGMRERLAIQTTCRSHVS